MRILIDARCLGEPNPSGVGQYATEHIRALFEIDTENEYVLLTTGWNRPALPFSLPKNARQVHARIPNKLLNATTLITRRPTLTKLAGGTFDLCFLPNLDIVSIPSDIPYVLTLHDASWRLFPELYSLKMRLWHAATRPDALIRNAATVIAPSVATKRDVVRHFEKSPDALQVIPHGISPAFTARRQPEDHGWHSKLRLPKKYVLFVGTIEPRKQIDVLIAAVADYRRQTGEDLALVIAGAWGWHTNAIKTMVRSNPWITLLGYVPDAARPTLYRDAAAFVWPSAYEGFGMPILEAMASGTPVITSFISSMPEVAGNAAILVDPHNPRDISLALVQLLSSTSLQQTLRDAGIKRAADFSWEKTARQTLNLFGRIPAR